MVTSLPGTSSASDNSKPKRTEITAAEQAFVNAFRSMRFADRELEIHAKQHGAACSPECRFWSLLADSVDMFTGAFGSAADRLAQLLDRELPS